MKKIFTYFAAVVFALSLNMSVLAVGSITYPAELINATTATGSAVQPNANAVADGLVLKAAPLTTSEIVDSFNSSITDGAVTTTANETADGGIAVQAALKTTAGETSVAIADAKTAASLLNVVSLTAPKDETGALLVDVVEEPVAEKSQVVFTAANAKQAKEMPVTTNSSVADLIKSTLATSDDSLKEAFGAAGMSETDFEDANVAVTIDANGDSYISTDNGFVAKLNSETVAEQEISAEHYTEEDFPLTLDFSVPGAQPGMAYQTQHKVNGIWQMEKTTVSVDKVSATVDTLSPFRITLTTLEPVGAVVEAAPDAAPDAAPADGAVSEAAADEAAQSKSGSSPVLPIVGGVAAVAVIAGAVAVKGRKKTTTSTKK